MIELTADGWYAKSTPERWQLVTAFARELLALDSPGERRRRLGELGLIDPELAARLAATLGLRADAELIPRDGARVVRSVARARVDAATLPPPP